MHHLLIALIIAHSHRHHTQPPPRPAVVVSHFRDWQASPPHYTPTSSLILTDPPPSGPFVGPGPHFPPQP